MKIKNKEIGYGEPTFVIAEAGINGGDNYEIAKQLVDIASDAGADAVKFQTFKPTELDFKNLTYDQFTQLKHYCDSKDVIFLSTPHSYSAIHFLNDLVPAYKIASPHITKKHFVRRIVHKQKPIIASTGSLNNKNKRASVYEVNTFLRRMNEKTELALLYCISKYPCYNFDVQDFIDFQDRYGIYPVGISCHSPDINYSIEAVKAGACIVEKHFTLHKDFDCPDKEVSITPEQLTTLIKEIRRIDKQ